MANITIFNNDLFGEVRTMIIDEEPWFVGKDVAEALGYKDIAHAILDHVDEDDRVNSKTQGQNDPELGQRGTWLINESGMYGLVFGSKKPEAKVFKKWVTSEVLPTIRKSGCYITEQATQESIDYQSKFGLRRIRKTIREAKDVVEIVGIWKEFKELSKIERDAHRIDNNDRIKCCKKVIDELQDRIANNVLDMNQYELPMYQGLMLEIKDEIQRLSNKMNGGIKSSQTKKISSLESQVEELQEQIQILTPPERIWTTVDYHGFSNNYQYWWDKEGHRHVRDSYRRWLNNFPEEQIPSREEYEIYQGIDFSKPIGIDINFINKREYDTQNLVKSFIDKVFYGVLHIDDNIIIRPVPQTVGYCKTTNEGKIMFAIYNTETTPEDEE